MSKQFCIIGLIVLGACSTLPEAEKGRMPGTLDSVVPLRVENGVDMSIANPVVIDPEVVEGFRFMYRFVTEVEFVLCLEGKSKNGRLVITGFRLARLEATTSYSVRYQPCSSDQYVGTAHNHPPVDSEKSLCYQSQPDRRSFGMDYRARVDVILCGDDRYYWVLKNGRSSVEKVLPLPEAPAPRDSLSALPLIPGDTAK